MQLRKFTYFFSGVLIFLALLIFFWHFVLNFVDDPLLTLQEQSPVRKYYNQNNDVIFLERTYDYQWRLPVELSEISEDVIKVIVACEDINFWQHKGVDYTAILRATKQNIFGGRIISGASTITMQLAGLSKAGRKKNWQEKINQALQARKLEKLYSKERILTEYLNRIPFGGKIYGIEAAANYYFNKKACQINLQEASLLCGLPQKPNYLRPDRYLNRARKRQKNVLQIMARHKVISTKDAEDIFNNEIKTLRDFTSLSYMEKLGKHRDGMFFKISYKEAKNAMEINCALDLEKDELLYKTLRDQQKQLPGVNDAAAVLIDNADSRVIAMVGTLDFNAAEAGQVNAALAIRSAGSALKPFIYAEAIDAGLICEDSIVSDSPIRYDNYSPGNFSGEFAGKITAGEALSMSYNTPAVKLFAELGTERMVQRLISLQLWNNKKQSAIEDNLSIALGSAGHSLFDLTVAFSCLAKRGVLKPAKFTIQKTESQTEVKIFSEETAAMISRVLSRRSLPQCHFPISWKTGTSASQRDAWCFVYTAEYTLGVWFGNKNAEPASALVGAEAAAPAAGAIINALYHNKNPDNQKIFAAPEKYAQLCNKSGLRASFSCKESYSGRVLQDIPLQQCRKCFKGDKKEKLMIIKPAPGNYITKNSAKDLNLSIASQPGNVHWFLNQKYLGKLENNCQLSFDIGRYSLIAVSEDDLQQKAKVEFTISSNEK